MLSETPVVTVHIPLMLRPYTAGHDEIMASGETVGEVLEAIGHTYPASRPHLLQPDGTLAAGLAVYLGATGVRERQGLATRIEQEELVSILPIGEQPLTAEQRQVRQAGPLDGVKHVLDDQPELGIAGDLQLAVEE